MGVQFYFSGSFDDNPLWLDFWIVFECVWWRRLVFFLNKKILHDSNGLEFRNSSSGRNILHFYHIFICITICFWLVRHSVVSHTVYTRVRAFLFQFSLRLVTYFVFLFMRKEEKMLLTHVWTVCIMLLFRIIGARLSGTV